MAKASGWGDIGVPLDNVEYIEQDEAWVSLLPEGSSVISTNGYGGSYWSDTGRIEVRLKDGSTETYFIKMSNGPVGEKMAIGEFESLKAMHHVSPALVPRPIGCGTFETNSDTHFVLCKFVELYEELPDVVDFARDIANLHRKSMKCSDSRGFGFDVPTCNETIIQYTEWNSCWESFFIETLKQAFQMKERVHGPEQEILELQPALLEKVCPRLLRPLETEGRVLRPCLVHGDLWDGNIAVRAKTGQPVIFDASALWAHNEYELHIWRGSRYRIGKTFMREYFHHFPKSPPEDDWNDRILLYSLVADLHSSTHFKHTERFRELVIQTMRELVRKFQDGYEGPAKRKDVGSQKDRAKNVPKPNFVSLGGYSNNLSARRFIILHFKHYVWITHTFFATLTQQMRLALRAARPLTTPTHDDAAGQGL